MPKGYRPNAAVIVTDGNGRVLLCERADATFPFLQSFPRVQTVQGGIDEGETARDAAIREVGEELGLRPEQFTIVDELSQTYKYDFPAEVMKRRWFNKYRGQEQTFFLAKVDPATPFVLDADKVQEFSRVWWGTPQALADAIWDIKRPGTVAALKAFGLLPDDRM